MANKAITIISGGLDSVTLAYCIKSTGCEQKLVSFNYGQRHKHELKFAHLNAHRLGAEHLILDLQSIGRQLRGSALTDDVVVPEGHYSADNMALTVVPNRNAIMLSIAWGIAVADKAGLVAYGAHLGDFNQYPDCRAVFVEALEQALSLGTDSRLLHLYAPFINLTKAQIVARAHELGVPFELTWSCYKGGEKHCGRCGTCTERLQAFDLNGLEDPVEYEDRTTWKKVVAEWENNK